MLNTIKNWLIVTIWVTILALILGLVALDIASNLGFRWGCGS